MKPVRTLLVDDEAAARRRIRELLRVDAEVQVIGECASGEDAVIALRREAPDLVFLDIRLPDMDGFEILEQLDAESGPLVVFVTAYDEHAVKAFGVRALDYLVKPFERARLYTAVGRAKGHLRDQAQAARHVRPGAPTVRAPGGRIAIRTDGRIVRVRLDEIERVEAERDTSRFHLRGGAVLLTRESIGGVEQRLPESLFMRVHRSHIVNISRVREVHPWFQGDSVLIMEDGTQVVTGRTFRQRIRVLLQ